MEEPRDVAISGLLLLSALFNNQPLATQAQRKASACRSFLAGGGHGHWAILLQVPPNHAVGAARDDRSALLVWQHSAVLAGMKENGRPRVDGEPRIALNKYPVVYGAWQLTSRH